MIFFMSCHISNYNVWVDFVLCHVSVCCSELAPCCISRGVIWMPLLCVPLRSVVPREFIYFVAPAHVVPCCCLWSDGWKLQKWFPSRQPNHHHHHHYLSLCLLSSPSSICSFSPSSRLSSSSACQTSISHTSCRLSPHTRSLLSLCLYILIFVLPESVYVRSWLFSLGGFGEWRRAATPVFYVFFVKYTSVSAVRAHKEQKDWLMEIVRKQNSYKRCIVSSDFSCVWM